MASIPTDLHDSHAHGEDQCHHHVSSMFTLGAVLTVLLVLTIATFGAYFLEQWIGEAFNVVIPQWVNVMVAMSIAAVKASLVLMYFMHLRHDNQLNTIIILFCAFAFALFLGLTSLDLGNRGTISYQKENKIIAGGNNQFKDPPRVVTPENPAGSTPTANDPFQPFAVWTAQPEIAEARLGTKRWDAVLNAHLAHAHGEEASDAQVSRPRTGLTDGLFDEHEAAHGGHGSEEHDAAADDTGGH